MAQWVPLIAVVRVAPFGLKAIYKTRRLFAKEYAEIEEVLCRYEASHPPGTPLVFKHRVTHVRARRRIHLLMNEISGVSLRHGHSVRNTNDPRFVRSLMRHTLDQRIEWSNQLATTIRSLHDMGLLCPDLRTEQLILQDSQEVIMVDIDSLVLMDGYAARLMSWRNGAQPYVQAPSVDTDLDQLARVQYELRNGEHMP